MLDNVNRKIGVEEARSERLEATFNANELQLAELEGLLNERLGVFGELFGVVRQVSGETSAQVGSSIISGEITGRLPALDELAKSKGLPKIKELRMSSWNVNDADFKYLEGCVKRNGWDLHLTKRSFSSSNQ